MSHRNPLAGATIAPSVDLGQVEPGRIEGVKGRIGEAADAVVREIRPPRAPLHLEHSITNRCEDLIFETALGVEFVEKPCRGEFCQSDRFGRSGEHHGHVAGVDLTSLLAGLTQNVPAWSLDCAKNSGSNVT